MTGGENAAIDAIDRRILEVLADEGRISWRELGERVHLSANAAADRVRRLEKTGVIARYRAELDPDLLGWGIEASIDVRRGADVAPEDFEASLRAFPEVLDALHLTGGWDYVVRVRVGSTAALDRFVTVLKSEHGATDTATRVVLRRVDGFPRQVPAAKPR